MVDYIVENEKQKNEFIDGLLGLNDIGLSGYGFGGFNLTNLINRIALCNGMILSLPREGNEIERIIKKGIVPEITVTLGLSSSKLLGVSFFGEQINGSFENRIYALGDLDEISRDQFISRLITNRVGTIVLDLFVDQPKRDFPLERELAKRNTRILPGIINNARNNGYDANLNGILNLEGDYVEETGSCSSIRLTSFQKNHSLDHNDIRKYPQVWDKIRNWYLSGKGIIEISDIPIDNRNAIVLQNLDPLNQEIAVYRTERALPFRIAVYEQSWGNKIEERVKNLSSRGYAARIVEEQQNEDLGSP